MGIKQIQYPIRKAHHVGTSVVLTLDPTHVKRLNIDDLRDIIQPDEVITWVDVNGNERPMGPTSWANELEAKACVNSTSPLVYATSTINSTAVTTNALE